MEKLINEANLNPKEFIKKYDLKIIIKFLKLASKHYYTGNSIIDDTSYDFILDYIKSIDPNNKFLLKIGYKIVKNKVKLPFFMGSLNKIKNTDEKILNRWIKNNFDEMYIYSDKLDGISGLLYKNNDEIKLFTRGDGNYGLDVTQIIDNISSFSNLNLPNKIAIRGELVMSRANFQKYHKDYSNARNLVAGIINSSNPNKTILNDINFVAYELIYPWINNQLEQFKILKNINIEIVYNEIIKNLEINNLENILDIRRKKSLFEIDGIVVSVNNLPNRNIENNPSYSFAFKSFNFITVKNTKVLEVKWNISKDGYLKPVLIIEPVIINNVKISNVTAFNAKFVEENKLGKGSIISITRSGDVIPHILKIIKHIISSIYIIYLK